MINLDKTNKLTSTILLSCIIIIIFTYLLYIICKYICKFVSRNKELFRNSSNDKRSKMIKIYKDDDILDPDENPEYNINDPDSTISIDPDNQEYNKYDQYDQYDQYDKYDQFVKYGLQ